MAWTIWGVAELGCWIGHFPGRWPTGRDTEECLEAHLACNIRHVAWDLGRSVLTYHSDLPGATCAGFMEEAPDAGAQRRAVNRIYRERCQLRAALTCAREREAVIYGRLCMNRHYHPGTRHRSRFADLHPTYLEVGRDGAVDVTRLSYGVPEYRQERVEILLEAASLGCAGLCLDFCRQPPHAAYHPSLLNPYRRETGVDPRALTLSADREAFLDWCRRRAEGVTQMLRELKQALDPLRARYDRAIAVQVRIPNDGPEGNLVAGMDVNTWCEEGLVDEIALSELHWLREYRDWDDRPYIELGRAHGIPVFSGNNCLPMQALGWSGECNPRGVNPLQAARRALAALDAGAAGVCVYQSDTGVQWEGMDEALACFADPERLRALVADPDSRARWPVTPENEDFGIDNHSRPLDRLGTADDL